MARHRALDDGVGIRARFHHLMGVRGGDLRSGNFARHAGLVIVLRLASALLCCASGLCESVNINIQLAFSSWIVQQQFIADTPLICRYARRMQ